MTVDPKFIRKFTCFQELTEPQIGKIAEISDVRIYPKHHIIFEEGIIGKKLYFLFNGKVEVLFNTGEPELTRIDLKEGEYVMGCSALMEPYMYAATNRSLTEVEVLEVDVQKLRDLMQEDCCLGMAIQNQLIKFLKDYIMKLRGMLTRS